MEKLQGGSGFACAAMVGWGIVGIGLAATAATGVGMLGALAAGAAMFDSAHNCVSRVSIQPGGSRPIQSRPLLR